MDDLTARAARLLTHKLALHRERLAGLSGRLEAVSPLATLGRGYALVRRRTDGQLVRSVAQAGPGDPLDIRVADGEIEAIAQETKEL